VLKKNQMDDVMVLVGGSIPKSDHQALFDLGVARIFPTSSHFDEIVDYIKNNTGDKDA
jgi:methylmalonyl-CoA mutase C-terminal domain/subunit